MSPGGKCQECLANKAEALGKAAGRPSPSLSFESGRSPWKVLRKQGMPSQHTHQLAGEFHPSGLGTPWLSWTELLLDSLFLTKAVESDDTWSRSPILKTGIPGFFWTSGRLCRLQRLVVAKCSALSREAMNPIDESQDNVIRNAVLGKL